jgi:CRP-like cAMP-binding protein
MKIFAEMDERQLESLLQYIKVVKLAPFAEVVRKGDHGDAMYLIVEGELRARVIVDGKETTLSTMTVGDSFGELALLDHGPRSADVLANRESTVLVISASALEQLCKEAPALATPFLRALSRAVAIRVRALTKRYEDTIHLARTTS